MPNTKIVRDVVHFEIWQKVKITVCSVSVRRVFGGPKEDMWQD